MHAHQLVAARPVDMQHQLFANQHGRLFGCRNMDDDVLGIAMTGGGDFDAAAVGALEKAAIAGLSARRCVKTGLIEFNAAVFPNSRDDRLRG